MKRNLLAVLIAGTLTAAFSTQAAEVEMYGLIDLSLGYAHIDDGQTTTDSFEMKSGPNSQSRIGIRGSEIGRAHV